MTELDVKEGQVVKLAGSPQYTVTIIAVTPYEIELGYFDSMGRYDSFRIPRRAACALVLQE